MQNYFTPKNLIIALIIIILVGGGIIWYLTRTPEIPSEEEEPGFFSRLFPGIGERELTEAERQRLEEAQKGEVGVQTPKAKVKKLVSENVAGAAWVKNPSTGSGRVRYIERETGHVYEISPEGENKTRISNTTIPGIFEVIWSGSAERAVLKYALSENPSVFSARFVASTTQGVFLPSEVKEIAFSPRGDRIAYSLPTEGGGVITLASPDNKNQRVLIKSPMADWKISWPEEGSIYISNSPSAFNDGFLYRLSSATGALTKLLGPRLGLSFITDGKNLVFSESDRNNKTILTSLLDPRSGAITSVGLKIIPEKCLWSKKEKNTLFCALPLPFPETIHPDEWYQGLISFQDTIVKINTEKLSALTYGFRENIDAVSLFSDGEEQNLFFLNRRDGSLWKMELSP